jgi:hypothetical protein
MQKIFEIVKYQASDEDKPDYYFFRETVVKSFITDKGFPVSNGLAWIVHIETGESLTVPHEYLTLVTGNNDNKEKFVEIITKLKNNKI